MLYTIPPIYDCLITIRVVPLEDLTVRGFSPALPPIGHRLGFHGSLRPLGCPSFRVVEPHTLQLSPRPGGQVVRPWHHWNVLGCLCASLAILRRAPGHHCEVCLRRPDGNCGECVLGVAALISGVIYFLVPGTVFGHTSRALSY